MPEERGETARRYAAAGHGFSGVIGLIAPISEPFCGGCGRIRLTASGSLYPCLLDPRFVDVNAAWPDGQFRPAIAERLIQDAVAAKQPEGPQRQATAMVALGG